MIDVIKNAPENLTIQNTMYVMRQKLDSFRNIGVSVSGGSDSDIIVDLISQILPAIDYKPDVKYFFFDTGIEYEATKRHLVELEDKYQISIERIRAVKPVPAGCREYGVPFYSKSVSNLLKRLQSHNFEFEDDDYEVLIQRYPRCISALKWWCNAYDSQSRFNISNQGKYLKDFIMNTPPDGFKISDRCCDGAKKNTAHMIDKKYNFDLKIIGIRRQEGGARSTIYKSCFTQAQDGSVSEYRPLFFWTDEDKQQYKEHYGLRYSDCYEVYGLKRTGCAGCPFSSRFEEELEVIKKYEPKLYVAVNNIFGKSYDYTRKYREYKENMKKETNDDGSDP